MSKKENATLAQGRLERRLRRLQQIMRLQDWNLSVAYDSEGHHLDVDDAACVDVYKNDKRAEIWVRPRLRNLDRTLLHELTHLHLHRWACPDQEQVNFQEEVCNVFADVVMGLMKGEKR